MIIPYEILIRYLGDYEDGVKALIMNDFYGGSIQKSHKR